MTGFYLVATLLVDMSVQWLFARSLLPTATVFLYFDLISVLKWAEVYIADVLTYSYDVWCWKMTSVKFVSQLIQVICVNSTIDLAKTWYTDIQPVPIIKLVNCMIA